MKEENIHIFDQYISNELQGSDKTHFENRLANDEAYRKEFEDYNLVVNASKQAGEIEFRTMLNEMHNEFFREAVKDKGRVRIVYLTPRLWLAAASLVVLVGLAFWFSNMQSATSREMFAENMSAYSIPVSARGDATGDEQWQKFTTAYENKNYSEALAALESVTPGVKPQYLVAFYKGVCMLSLPSPDAASALKQFEIVQRSSNNFHEQSLWYTGLSYLQLEQKENAIKTFELQSQTSKFKNDEAAKILDELRD